MNPHAATSGLSQPLRAALLMLGSSLAFAGMVVMIRLASSTIDTTEIAFFRNAFGLLVLLPLVLRPGRPLPRTRHARRYLVRTSIGLASMLCAFWVISRLPLSQAVSLSYSAPIFVTIGATLLLGETVRIRRWAAVAAGFIGVLVILRPWWSHAFTSGMLVAILAAILSALVSIQNKQLSQLDPPDTVVFYTYVFWTPMSLLPALAYWRWPDAAGWLWLAATGVLGTIGQLLWVRALRIGEVSALQPVSFIQLPVVVLCGWWLFAESPDRWTLIGAAIILVANAYIAHREALLARRAATSAPVGPGKPGE